MDTVQRNLTATEFADAQTRLFPKQWLDAMIESRPDALVYQWIVTTKIYPSMHAVPDISRFKKKLTSPIFTTVLYWQSLQTSGFNETNKLPGFKYDRVPNEFVVEFHFPALEDERVSKIRIDPASEMKSIWIKNAYIVDAQGSVLWQWSGAGSDADLINAFWSGVTPAEGRILMAANNDPQWYPDVPSDVLASLNKGDKFVFTLCDDSASIDTQLEIIWRHRLELSAEELRQMSLKVSQTEDLVCELEKNSVQKIQEINELIQSNVRKAQEIIELNQGNAQRAQEISELTLILNEKEAYLQSIIDSKSWKITKPLRYIRRKMSTSIITRMRLFTFGSFRVFWRIIPMPLTLKNKLKAALIKNFPSPFHQYSKWITTGQHNTQQGDSASALSIYEPVSTEVETVHYVARLNAAPLENKPVRLICFYLPQFHAIPQNDAWWGEGFTEWSNVRPAQPQFHNHYQPHVPGELGYYDLLDTEVQRRQIDLAKLYGIEGFCFYFYWFGGTRLLEKPIENYLNDRSLDLPFCLCWANENWSRRWDGLDHEVLIAQQHSPEDDLAFIEHVARYMRDPRYIRINGKPLLLVYRPGLLPYPKETVARWRDWCRQNGIGEIYLTYTQSFEALDPATYDFDAAVEFPPNNSAPPDVTNTVTPLSTDFAGRVYDARVFAERSENYQQSPYTLFRGVCPSWDNTARRRNNGTIFLHSSPLLYQRWLANAIRDTVQHRTNHDERLIFVNAWNEWAEGAHLEPDERYGYAYLEATRMSLSKGALMLKEPQLISEEQSVALVIHAFYTDVFTEIMEYVNKLSSVCTKLYVTTTEEHEHEISRQLENIPHDFVLKVVENRGRDILPFLNIMPEVIAAGHTFMVKVHTKKSLHRQDGETWRRDLYNKTLTNNALSKALTTMKENSNIGILGPDGHLVSMGYFWGSNTERVVELSSRMGVSSEELMSLNFVAGSMFTARVDAIQPLLNLAINESDFEPELGQVDGTLAHAIERLFSISAHSVRLMTTSTDEVVLNKYQFVS